MFSEKNKDRFDKKTIRRQLLMIKQESLSEICYLICDIIGISLFINNIKGGENIWNQTNKFLPYKNLNTQFYILYNSERVKLATSEIGSMENKKNKKKEAEKTKDIDWTLTMDLKDRAQAIERVIVEDICSLKYRKYQRDPFLLKRGALEKHSEEIIRYIERLNQIAENQRTSSVENSELNSAHRYQVVAILFLRVGALLPDKAKTEALKSATWGFDKRRGWPKNLEEPRKDYLNLLRWALLNYEPRTKVNLPEFPFLILDKKGLRYFGVRDFESEEKDVEGLDQFFIEGFCKMPFWKYRRNPNLLTRAWFENYSENILDFIETKSRIDKEKRFYSAETIELRDAHMYQFIATLILETGSVLPDKVKNEVLKSTIWEFEKRRGQKDDSSLPRKNFLNLLREAVLNYISGIKYFFPDSPPWQIALERYVVEVKGIKKLIDNLIHPNEITHLDLSECGLKQIPDEVFFLTKLVELNLNHNALTIIPKEIGNIKSLKELHIASNNISEIPKEIGNLTNLEVLDLSHNKLTALPDELGNLSSLRRLLLIKNNLIKLPTTLNKIASLYRVKVLCNPIDYDELNLKFPSIKFDFN